MAPHPTSSAFLLLSLFNHTQVCRHLRPASCTCEQVCVWPPRWPWSREGREWCASAERPPPAAGRVNAAFQHLTRRFHTNGCCLAWSDELARESPDGGYVNAKEGGTPQGSVSWHPSAKYTHPGLSQSVSRTPEGEPRVCCCQGQKATTTRACLCASPAATDQESWEWGDRAQWLKAGHGECR